MVLPHAAVRDVVANVVLLSVAMVAVGLRFTAKSQSGTKPQPEDWSILACLVCAIGLCVMTIWGASDGVKGVPFETMTWDIWVSFRKILFSEIIICHFTYGLIKISVLLFYKRIFNINKSFRTYANIVLGINVAWMISAFFSVLFCARGVSTFWTTNPLLDGTQYTVNLSGIITAMAVLDIVLDLVILSLPVPLIKSLRLGRKQKVSLFGIFLLGGFCLVATIIRLYYARTLLTFTGVDTKKRLELTENNALWASIEVYASITTSCLPTLGPLFRGREFPGSLLRSIRSLFSTYSTGVRSEKTLIGNSNAPSTSSSQEKEKRPWYELRSGGANPSTSSSGATHDLEMGSPRPDGITVTQSLSVHSGRGK